MIETKTREIGGSEYEVTQFPAMEALRIKTRLAKMILPSIGEISQGGADQEINYEAISHAIAAFADNLNEKEFTELVTRLLKNTSADGKPMYHNGQLLDSTFDEAFAGNLMNLYKVLAFVLEVNYPDFFAAASSIGSLIGVTGSSESNATEKK